VRTIDSPGSSFGVLPELSSPPPPHSVSANDKILRGNNFGKFNLTPCSGQRPTIENKFNI
jgi:hypothetical protein